MMQFQTKALCRRLLVLDTFRVPHPHQEKEAEQKQRELEAAENELQKKRAEAAEKEKALQTATEQIRGACMHVLLRYGHICAVPAWQPACMWMRCCLCAVAMDGGE